METLNHSLLARLVEQPVPPGVGKVDFTNAMSQLGVTSIFDIVERPKAEFIRQLARCNDDDGAQAYENALSYATQLQWLYDQQPVNARPAATRHKRDQESNVPDVLNEDWENTCPPGAIAAIDSPVAYLRTLFLFATQLEMNGTGTKAKIPLSQRRPDLKNLAIDHDTTFAQRPLLTLIEDMLRKQIKLHRPQEKLHHLLSEQLYPLTLPYHHHHLQCRLGLSGTQHALGEMNYRLSKRLPFDAAGSELYGAVETRNGDAQCLLSELNPQQQKLLTLPPVTENTLYATYFGTPLAPKNLDDFLKCTALDTAQLQALLAQNSFAPHASRSAPKKTVLSYGARYVNGTEIVSKLEVGQSDDKKTAKLLNTSLDRFDRLHRMIRLQKWFDLPFAELDTLIVSAMAFEGTANAALQISTTTLRALGVYRYLRGRYRLKPLEFAAWLDRLPVQASANEQPLFDQVFNRTLLSGRPLPLDDQAFDSHTRQQLCAALALSDTPDSLQLLIEPGYETQGMSPHEALAWQQSLHTYPLWSASQQLRYHPQNFLDPTLREDKSESFEQLENELNQHRIQPTTVQNAVQGYLSRFENVASIQTLNGYIDGNTERLETSPYYFVGKSPTDNLYYWRSLDLSQRSTRNPNAPAPLAWTDWKPINLTFSADTPSHSIRPVMFNHRLFIVWAESIKPAPYQSFTAQGNGNGDYEDDTPAAPRAN